MLVAFFECNVTEFNFKFHQSLQTLTHCCFANQYGSGKKVSRKKRCCIAHSVYLYKKNSFQKPVLQHIVNIIKVHY